MTAERMRWHCEGLESALAGRLVTVGATIHTDDEFARANGLPGRVADGMISTNWLSGILLEAFGDAYLIGGSLRTRYRRPVFADTPLTGVVQVAERRPGPDSGDRLVAAVWCETPDGERVTEGEASVPLP
jgi:acyl dehydratase